MSWEVYTRGPIHIHRLAAPFYGIWKFGTKLNGSPFPDIFYGIENNKLWWAWNREKIEALGKKIISNLEDPKKAKKHLDYVEKYARSGIKVAEKSFRVDLGNLSNSELAKFYKKLNEDCFAPHALLEIDIDCVDLFFEDHLKQKLNKPGIYSELSRPSAVSYLTLREIDLMSLALRKKPRRSQDLQILLKKYWWTNLGWENVEILGPEFFEKEINKFIKQKNLKYKIKQILRQPQSVMEKRKYLIRKYELSSDIQRWLKMLDRYTYLHDLRKEMQVKTLYALYRVLLEIQNRYGFSPVYTEWLLWQEVISVIKTGKLDKKECEQRSRASCIIVSPKGVRLWSGEKAEEVIKHEVIPRYERTRMIQGLGVTKGKAVGTVKVCNGYQQAIAKVRKGDVLVTGMTLPDYLPAMKKAAAIVTDEGGITCHAAIVSRELGKVCVVRAKVATYVLEDGDRVEVDASKGTVKILAK